MRMLDFHAAEALLAFQGLCPSEIKEVLTGFDLNKPMYEHQFWPDDELYQLVRMPSATDPTPSCGNWFGLAGITTAGVAINSGLSGRRLVGFKVVYPFHALEGAAAPYAGNIRSGIGGPGGQTQIYIARRYLPNLEATGDVGPCW